MKVNEIVLALDFLPRDADGRARSLGGDWGRPRRPCETVRFRAIILWHRVLPTVVSDFGVVQRMEQATSPVR